MKADFLCQLASGQLWICPRVCCIIRLQALERRLVHQKIKNIVFGACRVKKRPRYGVKIERISDVIPESVTNSSGKLKTT